MSSEIFEQGHNISYKIACLPSEDKSTCASTHSKQNAFRPSKENYSKSAPLLLFFFVCSSLVLHMAFVLSLFVSHLTFIWCFERALRRDCNI